MPASDDPSDLTQARLDALGAGALSSIAGPEEREKALALAERSAGIGVWDVDLATQTARGTAQFFHIMGLESTDRAVPLEAVRAVRHPDDRERVVRGFRHAVAQGADSYEVEYRIIRPDGEVRWIFGRGRVVRDAHGTPVRYSGVDIDITERKQAEVALAESEARLALAQEAAGIGIWDWDLASGAVRLSAQQSRLLGVDPATEAVDYEAWRLAIHPQDRERADGRLMAALAERAAYQDEYRVRLPDGRVRWLTAKGTVVLDPAGTPLRMIGVTYDETERREAVEALAKLNEELESRIEERTAELLQLQKLETLGQLTGGIAHDFNNLLAVVLGNLQLLRKRFGSEEAALRLIDGAIQGAARGADLTRRLLAFARRQEFTLGRVDLRTQVRAMSDLLARSLGPIIRIDLDLPEALPPAYVDASQLELAILNLAVNARDAMPLGGTLTITASREAVGAEHPTGLAPGDYVVLRIIDSGEGMTAATLARAKEPFFTTKGVGKGTGLGLAVVHGFAAQSGGSLHLGSQPGKGTTAAIWLPVADRGAAAATRRVGGEPSAAAPAHSSPLSVLVVDDDALVLMGTAAMLEDLGHWVVEASSAKHALEQLRAEAAVDLVITDQAMPTMTGAELAAVIAAEWPGLPVILTTGYAELPKGADPNLPRIDKPYTQDALAAAIAQVAGAARAATKVVPLKPR